MVSTGQISNLVSQVGICATLLCVMREVVSTSTANCNEICEDQTQASDNCRNRCLFDAQEACRTSTSLDLRDGRLSVLGEGCFRGYRHLGILSLVNNIISNITRGAFQDCDSLIKLYLQNNLLETLEDGIFQGAISLEVLDLSENQIVDVHPDALRDLSVLTNLNIYANRIGLLSNTTFQHTPSLQFLHLSSNILTDLPPGIFGCLAELRYLDLKNNRLRVLDGKVFDGLQNLEELNLSGNLITSISDFPDLPKLTTLYLYGNKLQRIGNLSIDGLDELYLGENNWTCTCSMSPLREWILYHQAESETNMICQRPLNLQGRNLANISRIDLCRPQVLTRLIPSSTSKEPEDSTPTITSTKTDSPVTEQYNSIDWSSYTPSSDTALSDEIIYVIAGGTTFTVIVLVLGIILKCLAHRTRMYLQQAQISGQQQNLPMQPHQLPVYENENQVEDFYSQVGQYSSSSSQGDLSPACSQEPPYLVPSIKPDHLTGPLRQDRRLPELPSREDFSPVPQVQHCYTLPSTVVSECPRAPGTVEASYMHQDFRKTTLVHERSSRHRQLVQDASWITSELRPQEPTENIPSPIHHTYMSQILSQKD